MKKNPLAFRHNNINGLRHGIMLKVPTLNDIKRTSKHNAIETLDKQNLAWLKVQRKQRLAALKVEGRRAN